METIVLPHLPDHPLQCCLFTDVSNASFLRQQLLDGNTDFEYAFLDAAVLLSRTQVLAACFRAINDSLQHRLKSKNVHSEIVFSLSPDNNISESFRRFGVAEMTKRVLAIKVGSNASQVKDHLMKHIEGRMVPFTDDQLAEMQDGGRIRKIYKIDVNGQEGAAYVVGSMVLKGS